MEQEIEIRELRPHCGGDEVLVAAFFDQMGPETRAYFNRNDGNRRQLERYLDGTREGVSLHWAALQGKRMVGYVFLDQLNRGVPWLGIAVAEDCKGKGIGRKLIRFCQDYCEEKEYGGILLTTHQANLRGQCLYERCGFVRQGIHPSGEVLYLWRRTLPQFKEA